FMVLVNGIDLNDGNMDMGKMKSVLDADVENIRNAKATVEKMIEEKMLGTEADGTIGVRLADGQINYHDKKGQEYIARNTALEFLKETEQGYILVHPGQENISFDQEGKMLRKEDRNGRGISFFYCEDGKLKKAETDNGSSLTYCYNQMGQLKKVTDHTGRSVLLQYEEEKLKKVITASGAEYVYRYGENGR
ncbi:hypothetical protein, partial [Roseburia inulinivorans]|uniref:hypothetical protein n=1 Tax=Roseburia inulinivorans TaxID=360807 RepID=UPI001A9A2E30